MAPSSIVSGTVRILQEFATATSTSLSPPRFDLLPGGHIHSSYLVTFPSANEAAPRPTDRYVLQRLNTAVFTRPALLEHNFVLVTNELERAVRARGGDPRRRCLAWVPTRAGAAQHTHSDGSVWRLLRYIEGTVSRTTARSPDDAYAAARAFGGFLRDLQGLDPPSVAETIPDFHDTPKRFVALERALEQAPAERTREARAEIELALALRPLAGVLVDAARRGELPVRVVHNDAKIANVLFDARSGEALCVIDLDTVMPGLSLYDFGDLVRSMASSAAEDEPDPDRIEIDRTRVEALCQGYLDEAGSLLGPAERARLYDAGRIMTLQQGVRFLTDFLLGDVYFRVERPRHNLERCRSQFSLLGRLGDVRELFS